MGGKSVADPDLGRFLALGGGGGGLDLLALSAIFPSVISSFFTQNKGGRPPRALPLDPPLEMCTILDRMVPEQLLIMTTHTNCFIPREMLFFFHLTSHLGGQPGGYLTHVWV